MGSGADYVVLLYDRKRYAGEKWDPGFRPGMAQFGVSAFGRKPERLFHDMVWSFACATYEEARAMVPAGGVYFDRSGNYPSPMVPAEGWYFDDEPPCPSAHGVAL